MERIWLEIGRTFEIVRDSQLKRRGIFRKTQGERIVLGTDRLRPLRGYSRASVHPPTQKVEIALDVGE